MTSTRLDPCRLDAAAQSIVEASGAPGLAVAVRAPGGEYLQGYGYADVERAQRVTPSTQFRIASLTKTFTATGVALLVEEGKLHWDDQVERRLPFFEMADRDACGRLTLRDLLCHRAGFGWLDPLWYNSPWDRCAVLRRAGRAPLEDGFRRGFRYSNIGFILAGEVAGRAAAATYEEFVHHRLLAPLGMRASGFGLGPGMAAGYQRQGRRDVVPVPPVAVDKANPACGLRSSARDLAKWLGPFVNYGYADGKRLIGPAALRELLTPHVEIGPDEDARVCSYFPATRRLHYCLGWFHSDYRGRTLVSHSGSLPGYRAHLAVLPGEGIGIAAVANLSLTWAPDAMIYSALDRLLGESPVDWAAHFEQTRSPYSDAAADPDPCAGSHHPDPQSFCGSYSHPAYGDLTIGRSAGTLTFEWTNYRTRMRPTGDDGFLLADLGCALLADNRQVRFVRGDAGEVEGLYFLDVRFHRVTAPELPGRFPALVSPCFSPTGQFVPASQA
ncbi:MAG: serine hydrolase [Bryobacteraceae bacterium]|nr:serine hydrolase [Bryobacteraceae bacterium]